MTRREVLWIAMTVTLLAVAGFHLTGFGLGLAAGGWWGLATVASALVGLSCVAWLLVRHWGRRP
jgi:Zn-dependent protease with chaperone function